MGRFGVRVHGAGEYPPQLRDAAHPIALLYYQGWWDLAASPSVAVVGTRRPSAQGLARTRRLVRNLVADGYTVVSGLAAGIDRMAHEAAMRAGGRTIAVIGTPLSHAYPKENAGLQRRLAADFLVISQVPLRRYEAQDYRRNRAFFPGAQRDDVGAERGDGGGRGGQHLGDADPGARGAGAGPHAVPAGQLLPRPVAGVAGVPGGAGGGAGEDVR